jgi:MYXO-CTERM domain-containing protein
MLAAAAGCVVAGLVWGGDPRPVLTGAEEIVDSADGRFRFHFTRDGGDAADEEMVAWAEAGFTALWAEFVDGDGWPAPPADLGEGGDDRLDVYLRDLDGNGYAHEVPLPDGTGCWIELDPGVARTLGETTFASVAAHELHHCLQFAVTPSQASWIYEATSTYAQYLLYGDRDVNLDLARDFLWQLRLSGSWRALDDTGSQFEYAGMVWAKFLVDRAGGDRGELRALWEAMADTGGWEAGHQAALGSLVEAAAEGAVWNLFACARDDGRHWRADPAACGLDGAVRPEVVAALPASGEAGPVARYGSAYVELVPDCATGELHVEVTPATAMTVQVVAVTPWQDSAVTAREAAAGETVRFDVPGWNGSTRVVVVGTSAGGAGSFAWSASATGAYAPPEVVAPEGSGTCEDGAAPAGCGCRSGEPGGIAVLLAVLAMVMRRFRRRTPVSWPRLAAPLPSRQEATPCTLSRICSPTTSRRFRRRRRHRAAWRAGRGRRSIS